MIAVVLLMFAAGIGIALTVSDPKQVTLRWLRLGAILAICFVAVATSLTWRDRGRDELVFWQLEAILAVPFILQLVAIQLGWRKTQRVIGIFAALAALYLITGLYFLSAPSPPTLFDEIGLSQAPILSSGLLGGFLMAMFLGHAYLTAGSEMTQSPFIRIVVMLGVLLLLRGALSLIFGLRPYLALDDFNRGDRLMNTVMLWARYLVGIVTPAIFTYMTYDCVKRRANQSATGILYVAAVLIILGEGSALALLRSTGLPF